MQPTPLGPNTLAALHARVLRDGIDHVAEVLGVHPDTLRRIVAGGACLPTTGRAVLALLDLSPQPAPRPAA
jgi:hypothetical protein